MCNKQQFCKKDFAKKWTLQFYFPHFTVLVLNQSPISVVFTIVLFPIVPKSILSGDPLYFQIHLLMKKLYKILTNLHLCLKLHKSKSEHLINHNSPETQFVVSTIPFFLKVGGDGGGAEECHFRGSMRSSSVYSEAGQKSVTSDEWIDLEETDTETYDNTDKNTSTSSSFSRASNVR